MMLSRIRQAHRRTVSWILTSKRMAQRIIGGVIGFLIIVMVDTPGVAQIVDPAEFVQDLGRRVSAQFGQDSLDQPERQRRFAALLDDLVDLDAVSALVLEGRWKQASLTERREFVHEFRGYLIHNFAGRLHGFGDRGLAVIDFEQDGDTVVLRTEIAKEGKALPVEWRLIKDRSSWRLCDLTLDHFSLAAILRVQFSDVLNRPDGGFAALLLLLREKSAS